MFITTMTVDAHQRMTDALQRIAGIADEARVIVRRRGRAVPEFFSVTAGFLRSIAARDSGAIVAEALNLRDAIPARTLQLDEARRSDAVTAVVLDGDEVVGMLTAVASGRGADPAITRPVPLPVPPPSGWGASPPVAPWAPPPAAAPAAPPPVLPPAAAPPIVPVAPPAPPSPPPPAAAPAPPAAAPAAPAPAPEEAAPEAPIRGPEAPTLAVAAFTASARLDSPEQVTVGVPFDVVVGLAPPAPSVGAGGQVVVDTALPEFDLVVTLTATGFTAARTRDVLHVVRANPASAEVTFTLVPEAFGGEAQSALLQVDFAFGGVTCGRAWRAVAVLSAAPQTAMAPVPSTPTASPPAPSTPVQVREADRPPDLVVTISENDDSTQLEWQFVSRHADVDLPSTQVRTRFRQHNAKSFAMQQVRVLHESAGAAAIGNRVLGVARTIADQIPSEAWRVLAAVWRKTAAEQRRPSVLLVSTDAYIPWELASTEAEYVDPDLADAAVPPLLGAQVCISRWNAPRPRGAGGLLYPPLPPPEGLDVSTMTLVVGDYLATSGQRPLPMAAEEGNELAALYRAVRLAATLAEIDPLFEGTLERDGMPVTPDVVHFACHGQIDPNPQFNGIVLNEGYARLDALYVAGSRLKRSFIFVNACQVGQATELLDDAGGLASSFLQTGASGFIAPLWNVDDQVAKDTAIGFYRSALDERVPVAEALRRRRALFDADADTPQPTHLAYVYYGHPNLVLARTP